MTEPRAAANGPEHRRDDHDTARGAARFVAAADPAARAAELAAELGADLAVTADQVRTALRGRLDAARVVAAADAIVADRTDMEALRREAAPALAREAAIDRLQALAGEVGRASRVRSQTEVAVTASMARRVSGGTGLAVHPSSLRAAAAAVVHADQRAEAAEAARTEADRRAAAERTAEAPGPAVRQQAHPEIMDEDAIDAAHTRGWAIGTGIGIAVVALAVGGLLIGAGNAVAGLLLALVGLLAGAAIGIAILRRGEATRADARARREAAESLATAAANADRTRLASAADAVEAERAAGERNRMEAAVERAGGEQRAARRAWEALAGPDADPYDIEAVVRTRDPQVSLSGANLDASPTIRTVTAFHRKALARWRVAWAAVGVDEPPDPDDVDQAVAGLPPVSGTNAALKVSTLEARPAAAALLARPLVAVDPGTGVVPSWDELPAGASVIVVRRETGEPEGLRD